MVKTQGGIKGSGVKKQHGRGHSHAVQFTLLNHMTITMCARVHVVSLMTMRQEKQVRLVQITIFMFACAMLCFCVTNSKT